MEAKINNIGKKGRTKANLENTLRKAWYHLRLSVRHPTRVPTWDAIILTAASPEQAHLYDWQLKRAKRVGRIAPSTVTLSVPDPNGHRIGSGAATLNALFALAQYYYSNLNADAADDSSILENHPGGSIPATFTTNATSRKDNSFPLTLMELVTEKHILLLHAGGDSKRVPWANPMGKVFLPLPYLASDDPDGPVPLLFDHILAIASCARQAFKNEGGLFTMTGDVLPCFDASSLVFPEDASCIITVPITLDIASNHGVIVASKSVTANENYAISLVGNLLQKPSLKELADHDAVLYDGRALLDTGIIAVRGKAWADLVTLALYSEPLILELLECRKEGPLSTEDLQMSLYEDLVAAWVPAKHTWLKQRPLGEKLVSGLGKQNMFSYCAYDLLFLHFGTSNEVLDHLSGTGSRLVCRRHLCSIPATTVSDIADSAIIISSQITSGVSVGEDSLVYDSYISDGLQIGSQCIVVGVHIPGAGNRVTEDSFKFRLPNRHCLWEVPLVGYTEKVIVFCGVHDNPKHERSKDGTFCGKPWDKVLSDLGIEDADLWGFEETQVKCMWNAKLFPILSYRKMLQVATWLIGLSHSKEDTSLGSLWRRSQRISLEELHRLIDFPNMCMGSSKHRADLAAGIVTASLKFGLLVRNVSQLCEEVLQEEEFGMHKCSQFLAFCPNLENQNFHILPRSRAYQVQVDLLRMCNGERRAVEVENHVWAAVTDETAKAVRYGFRENILESSNLPFKGDHVGTKLEGYPDQSFVPRKVKVELPVRVDFVGGWSDTPPWSLERAGCVLNMAITLEGSLPIGTVVETTETAGVYICDDSNEHLHIKEFSSIAPPFDSTDPFRLVKSALLVTNVVNGKILQSSLGLKIRTWADVPRGSGLGTSSILAAAVVKALLQITEEDASNENVARLVLVLEQFMGTGGGWQDQIGGLYPGIKCTSSFPGIPLRLQVITLLHSPQMILQLQQRLLVVFTGQVRLAHQVLQKVVTRYLRHDNLLISSIKRLSELAKMGREALMNCEIDELGDIMLEAWRLHQELDPYCSNEFVDKLFAFSDPYCCGYKLVGAGGGGFALLLAKNAHSAEELRVLLDQNSDFDVKVYQWNIFIEDSQ